MQTLTLIAFYLVLAVSPTGSPVCDSIKESGKTAVREEPTPSLNTTAAEIYYFHPDHLGSSAWVTDTLGQAVQHLGYLPWGERYISQKTGNFSTLFTFSGKERDEETGYSYFGQRFYDSQLSIWLSVDPMRGKYPSLSPFVYCANNPIKLVDPNGMEIDEWEINKKGKIVNHIKTDKHDAFYMVDNKGNRIAGKEISFDYGTIEKFQSQYSDQKGTTFDWFNVRGDDNGTQLFEFFAKNTNVEFSQLLLGKKGDNGLNIISTSHTIDREYSMKFLIDNKYKYGYTIRGHKHSHPNNTLYPSGLDTGTHGDMWFSNYLTEISIKNGSGEPFFRIFIPKTGNYIKYNRNSTLLDFPAIKPINLDEVEVIIK